MSDILGGMVLVNGTDIWKEYGVFLAEERRGGMDNLTAILTPSKAKADVAVSLREEHGERYAPTLEPRNEARDVTLSFALYESSRKGWMKKYFAFIMFLKSGWLNVELPQLGMTMRLKYIESTKFTPLTYLWREGVHAGRFRVQFREPVPVI